MPHLAHRPAARAAERGLADHRAHLDRHGLHHPDRRALGFLGLGAPPPAPEWGRMISESREFLPEAWWYALAPGLAIFLVVMGFNLLGDGLRDILDPRIRRAHDGRPLLEVRDLRVSFATEPGVARVLDGVNLAIRPGEIMGLVGESGCGKTTLARAILGILPPNARNRGRHHPLRRPGPAAMAAPTFATRGTGRRITFVPQDPYGSFNPLFRVGQQIMELMKWKSPRRTAGERGLGLCCRYPQAPLSRRSRCSHGHAARGADPRSGASIREAAARVLGRPASTLMIAMA